MCSGIFFFFFFLYFSIPFDTVLPLRVLVVHQNSVAFNEGLIKISTSLGLSIDNEALYS